MIVNNHDDPVIVATHEESTEEGEVFKFEYKRLSPGEGTDLVMTSLTDLLKEFRYRDLELMEFSGNFTFHKKESSSVVRTIDLFNANQFDMIGYKSDLVLILDYYCRAGWTFSERDLRCFNGLTEIIKRISPRRVFTRNINGILAADEINDELKRLNIPYRLSWNKYLYIIERLYKIEKIEEDNE